MEVISAKKLLEGLCEAPDEPITAVVTEKGIVYPPYTENLRKVIEQK